MEEHNGKRRRKQENISILYRSFRRNSLPPSSSRSFRTQSHWSYTAGQLCWFRTISSSTFTTSDVQSIYTASRIQDWYREDKIWAKDKRCSSRPVDPVNKEHKDPETVDLKAPRLAWYHQKKWKKHQNTVYWVVTSNLLRRKDWSSIRHDRTPSFFTKHSHLIVSRKLFGWKLEKSYTRKYMRYLDLLRRFPFKTIGWKNWVQKLLEVVKTPNKPNQRPKMQL